MIINHGTLSKNKKKHTLKSPEYKAITTLRKKVQNNKCKRVVIAGIGGSNLGVKAITDIFKLPIIFLESYNHTHKPRKGDALIVISKSGNTKETLYHYKTATMYETVHVVTTKGNKLWKHAKRQNYKCSSIPELVGGRYSIFTAVGQIPLSYTDFNVDSFLKGAKDMRDICKTTHVAARIAHSTSANILDTFVFHSDYESLGKWNRQLIAESLGKKKKGFLPTVSIGTVDLHSMLQLYLDGPFNVLTQFVRVPTSHHDTMDAIIQNYSEQKKTWYEIGVDTTAYDTGAYMMFMMHYVMELGQKIKVNTFNQPAVERYKRIMRGEK